MPGGMLVRAVFEKEGPLGLIMGLSGDEKVILKQESEESANAGVEVGDIFVAVHGRRVDHAKTTREVSSVIKANANLRPIAIDFFRPHPPHVALAPEVRKALEEAFQLLDTNKNGTYLFFWCCVPLPSLSWRYGAGCITFQEFERECLAANGGKYGISEEVGDFSWIAP